MRHFTFKNQEQKDTFITLGMENETKARLFLSLTVKQYYNWDIVKSLNVQVGDKLYVHSSLHISSGSDDIAGGLATVKSIQYSDTLPKDHYNYAL